MPGAGLLFPTFGLGTRGAGFDDRAVTHVEVGPLSNFWGVPLAGGQYENLGQAKYMGKKANFFLRALRTRNRWGVPQPPPPLPLGGESPPS